MASGEFSGVFTSESVTRGHPDKVADQISDSILDALLAKDEKSRAAVETLVAKGFVVIAGEVTTDEYVEIPQVVRKTITDIGYDRGALGFDGNTCGVLVALNEQSAEINVAVSGDAAKDKEQGAGDQGLMFGYACKETEALMPMPIYVAHRLAEQLEEARRSCSIPWLRPDGKTQVSIEYENAEPVRLKTVLISAHHDTTIPEKSEMKDELREHVLLPALPPQFADQEFEFLVNPSGKFEVGGPVADAGLTGRKIIVDTYGGYARHGGGAFSGKDPSKVDRSASYAARWVAKNLVAAGAADRCELQIAYAIGEPKPVSLMVETFGTGKVPDDRIQNAVCKVFDLSPEAIIKDLGLLKPIYAKTAAYGHFGRDPEGDCFKWEQTNRVDDLKSELGL